MVDLEALGFVVEKLELDSCWSTTNVSSQGVGTVIGARKRQLEENAAAMPYWHTTRDGYVKVWTDGACSMNGYRGAKAGIGVFFGDNNRWNLSEPVMGRATSNIAEIQAVTRACYRARDAGKRRLMIYTDSEYVINCISKWIQLWRERGWYTASGSRVKNIREIEDMDEALDELQDFKYKHVKAHLGNYCNEQADTLAKAGAERYDDEYYY